MSVHSVDQETRPQGMPDRVIWPHPDLSESISFKCWDCDRGWSAPILPFPRFEDELTLAILTDVSDDEEMMHSLTPICGRFQGTPEFCLPWDEDDEPLAHYLGVIARDEMGDAVTKLVKAGVPLDWIVLVDWDGERVYPILRNF